MNFVVCLALKSTALQQTFPQKPINHPRGTVWGENTQFINCHPLTGSHLLAVRGRMKRNNYQYHLRERMKLRSCNQQEMACIVFRRSEAIPQRPHQNYLTKMPKKLQVCVYYQTVTWQKGKNLSSAQQDSYSNFGQT